VVNHLRDVEADVLTIMDSCYTPDDFKGQVYGPAPDPSQGTSRHTTRSFELIAAAQEEAIGFTEPSFTLALIESLIELQNASPRPFDTSRLHGRVMDRMRPLVNIPPLYNCIGSRNPRHIRLAPLPKTASQRPRQVERAASIWHLQIQLAGKSELKKEEVTRLAAYLAIAVKTTDLDISALDWANFTLSPRLRSDLASPPRNAHQEVPRAEHTAATLHLQVAFARRRSLSENEVRRLRTCVAVAVKAANLGNTAVDWTRFERRHQPDLAITMGVVMLLQSWPRRWRGERLRRELRLQKRDQRKDEHSFTSPPLRTTPPQSLTDASSLPQIEQRSTYGNGRYGFHSSGTGSEIHSTSKPLRGSIGYSSVDDDNSRLLSSVTGPETHGRSLGENDDIGDDCADDEHVSDTESIRTDGRAHNLPQETEHSLANDFADHIIENLTLDKLKDLFGQSDALEATAELVRDFAILLGVDIEGNSVQTQAVTFVRHKRRIIARCLASAATAWRPSAEGQVSIVEKMRLLHFDDADPSQYEDPNAERRFVEPDEDTDRLNELHLPNDEIPELRDVVLARPPETTRTRSQDTAALTQPNTHWLGCERFSTRSFATRTPVCRAGV
jgi:hypothetical protein